jgi:hypothetical protein
VRFEESAVQFHFDSADEAVDECWDRFGPIVMLRRALEPDDRGEEIRVALRALFERWNELDDEGLGYQAPTW